MDRENNKDSKFHMNISSYFEISASFYQVSSLSVLHLKNLTLNKSHRCLLDEIYYVPKFYKVK